MIPPIPELAVAGRSESNAAFTLPGVRGASSKAGNDFFIGVFDSPIPDGILLMKPFERSCCRGSASSLGLTNGFGGFYVFEKLLLPN